MEKARIDIISSLPEIFNGFLVNGIIRIAQEKGLIEIITHNLHDYADNKFKHIDDTPFGGGAGMIIRCQPVFDCIEKLKSERNYDEIIFTAADGIKLSQSLSNELSLKKNIIILCGRYKGIDQRIRDTLITREISIGDYVLSGGEIPAMVIIDSIIRLIPGVLGNSESALQDSYQDGLLEPPYYTKPLEYNGLMVPEVLTRGNHKKIADWKMEESLKKTQSRRPDLLNEV